jgi:hypothetical protein
MKKATLGTVSMMVRASASLDPAAATDLAPAPDTSEWRFTLAPRRCFRRTKPPISEIDLQILALARTTASLCDFRA